MPAEVTRVFGSEARLQHIEEVALSRGLGWAQFDTRDFGKVTIQRGDDPKLGYLARSEFFDMSVIVGSDGDQAAITTFDLQSTGITSNDEVAQLREWADAMLQQCNNATRR